MIPATPGAARTNIAGPGRRWDLPLIWICALACVIAGASPAPAANSEPTSGNPESRFLRFDSLQSQASFEVKVLLMFPVKGQFGSVSGGVHIDGEQARVEAAIDANAVSMSRKTNEAWVKSAEFFDVDRHPQIFFDSQSFPLSRLREGGTLPGTLDMRGVKRPVVFALLPAGCERPALDCTVQAHGTVRRSEFGMDSRRGALSDKVELKFNVRIIAPATSSTTQ